MKVKQLDWDNYRASIFSYENNVYADLEHTYEIIESASFYYWELTSNEGVIVAKSTHLFDCDKRAMEDAQLHFENLILSGLEIEDGDS